MNETLEQLFSRKSVRVFTEQEISPADKTAILQAAMQAPTAGNQQLYTILDITDPALKEKLSETCDHQPFIAKAPLVLIFCADCSKWLDAYREAGCEPRAPGAGDLMLAVLDAAVAAQNAVAAAWSMGIGSCYIGDVMEQRETHQQLLNLPDYVFPAAMLVFGYPTQQQKERIKPERFALEEIVCENTYQRKSAPQLREMFEKRCGALGYDTWVQKFCSRKYNSDFAREMTRSVEKYIEDFKQK